MYAEREIILSFYIRIPMRLKKSVGLEKELSHSNQTFVGTR
jgi:hypothetical protein